MIGRKSKDGAETKFLLEMYAPVPTSEDEHIIEALDTLAAHAKMPGQTSQAFLNDVARVIYKAFGFKEIAIGMRDKEGRYRYVALLGFRDEVKALRQKLSYSFPEMMDSRAYPSNKIDKTTQIYTIEDRPMKSGEEALYNRPSLLGQERLTGDSMIEGDYIDLSILGPSDDLIGWIEVSGPRDGKFPSRLTVKWLEFIAATTATFMMLKEKPFGERPAPDKP